ncbi:MAG: putative selenium-dependent hydroxylase accessory protein YqeC [Spirochaetales bacterium]|nr:putative selenium-dependent hydroxylase accessory protein YqeC [Spirochaetales bacterium]
MDLYGTLVSGFSSQKPFVSITGGGGKTTLMIGLASYLRKLGKRVLMTTTTKIMSPHLLDYGADRIFADDGVLSFFPDEPICVLYALSDGVTSRWISPPVEHLDVLRGRYDAIICEADGSRRLPLKVHTNRDPVVPGFTTDTVSITGLWGIGVKASEVSFGDNRDMVIDGDYLQWYIDNPQGLLKGTVLGRRTVLFNGADDCENLTVLEKLRFPTDARVYACSEKEGKIYERIR